MLKAIVNSPVRSGNQTIVGGDLVIGTAGNGIDFSANANAPGMTSELLDWYEEGTWTPADASGAGLTLTVNQATYTRIGRMVVAQLYVTYPANIDVTGAAISLPFTPSSTLFQAAPVLYTNSSVTMAAVNAGNTYMSLYAGLSPASNGSLAGNFIIFTINYFV